MFVIYVQIATVARAVVNAIAVQNATRGQAILQTLGGAKNAGFAESTVNVRGDKVKDKKELEKQQ